MKRFADSTVEAINNLSPDELVAHGALTPTGKTEGEFICPCCGNGSGKNRTGITFKKFSDGHYGYYCQNCVLGNPGSKGEGRGANNIRILSFCYGLDATRDFREIVRRACFDFGLACEYEDGSAAFEEEKFARPRRPIQPPPAKKISDEEKARLQAEEEKAKRIAEVAAKLIDEDLNLAADLVKVVFKNGWRGLPAEFLLRFGCRFADGWIHPNIRAKSENYKDFATPTPRMLIPHEGGYLARLTCAIENLDEQTQAQFKEKGGKYLEVKMHAGRSGLFNPSAFENKMMFVTEGEVDAMTLEFVGYHACATCGCSHWQPVVGKLKSMPMDKWPRIIILFDYDKAGKENAAKLKSSLDELGCQSVVKFLFDDDDCAGDVLDCNDILREEYGEIHLRDLFEKKIIVEAEAEFKALSAGQTNTPTVAGSSAFEGKHSPTPSQSSKPFNADDCEFYFGSGSTDRSNGERLERFCGDRVKFLIDEERFLTFEDGVWTRRTNSNHNVVPECFALADQMRAALPAVYKKIEAEGAVNGDDEKAVEKAKKRARAKILALEDRSKYTAGINALVGLRSIRIMAKDLDEHPQLLNVSNGVVDLESGRLMEADSSLYLTQQCSAAYDRRADSSLVEKFFADIQPDEDTRRGLLRWLGYCLTGSVRDEKFLCWQGGGRNGKGSTSKMILRLLGNYATSLPTDALLKGRPKDSNAATTGLNGLCKARFAISEELPQGALVDSSLVKNLSGGDDLPFRPLYGEFRRVAPTHKLNLSGNFTPRLENFADKGLRERLLVMPFDQTFTGDRADPHLKEKLLGEENLRGLLKILVEEARLWYRDGLVISSRMLEATRENLEANDFAADFLTEYVEVTKDTRDSVPRKTLLELFKDKCPQTRRFNDRELSKLVVDKLSEQGVEFGRGGQTGSYRFKGIRLVQND